MATRESGFGNSEIGEQPAGLRSGGLSESCNDSADLLRAETIEKEMSNDQIVTVVRHPCRDILFDKRHAAYLVWRCLQNMSPRQLEHSFAAIDAIDSD